MAAAASCFHALSTPVRSSPSPRHVALIKPAHLIVCRAQKRDSDTDASISRRLALTVLIGAAAVGTKVSPADAAYGEAANVFGKPKSNTDFKAYDGDGFKLSVPAKWNPSKEVEFPGQVLRYEDNFDTTSNLSVMVTPTDKKSITDFGPPEDFLSKATRTPCGDGCGIILHGSGEAAVWGKASAGSMRYGESRGLIPARPRGF